MIGERFNFEDVFFRDLTVCVLDTLEGEVRWVNKFSSGDRVVNVPFYYSLTGDERFLLDSFTDDIVSNSRYVDLNTDIIPRGHLTLTSYEIRGDEFANPNVWLKMVVENETEIRNMLTKVRAIPITVKYDLVIFLSSEIDTFKCSQAIMDTLWLYRFMYFEHNFMNIDAVMQIPDSNNIEINREKNLTSDNTIKLTVSFDVQTYYPAYRKPKLPDVLPYSIGESEYISKTLSVRVDLFKPTPEYFVNVPAKANIIILGVVPNNLPISLTCDYPEPNSIIVENFTFSTNTTSDQATELSDYINAQNIFTSKSSGSNVQLTAPEGSGGAFNSTNLVIQGVFNEIAIVDFNGGKYLDLEAAKIIFSENHIITTSSDGSFVVQVGAGAASTGNYLNVNLKESGLKINVYVNPQLDSFDSILLVSGDDLPISSSNVDDNLNALNQISSNSFSSPTPNGDFRDIITLPKRTRWYNNLRSTRGGGVKTKTPYNSQNLNNQKKI